MLSKADKIIFSIIGLLVILIVVFWNDVKAISGVKLKSETEKGKKENKEKKKDKRNSKDNGDNSVSDVLILQTWELPSDLKEVSGISYIDEQRIACIQDEEGTIFIFNRASDKIEKEIPFAGTGDYEGIAVKGNTAYVVRADGRLYEVDMSAGKSSVKEYKTPLTAEHNVEGLCYDKNKDQLLLAIKDDEPAKPGYKGIYAFDLSKKTFIKDPAFKIDLQHEVISTTQDKKNKSIMPSAIAIHPLTNDIFITDGPKANLLIMDKSGIIKRLVQLGNDFSQPEGITFSPQGEIFISNEGSKQPGNILKIEVKQN
jgi:uncharacterized protein YjiK